MWQRPLQREGLCLKRSANVPKKLLFIRRLASQKDEISKDKHSLDHHDRRTLVTSSIDSCAGPSPVPRLMCSCAMVANTPRGARGERPGARAPRRFLLLAVPGRGTPMWAPWNVGMQSRAPGYSDLLMGTLAWGPLTGPAMPAARTAEVSTFY